MHIFITGASGFVGGAAARQLIAAGHKVTAMSRSEASDATIRALGAEPVRCNLETITHSHLQRVDAVVHAAAFLEIWGPRDAWFKGNVLGTQAMLDAARVSGVRRFIHISTEAVICHGQDVRDVDETYPLAPHSPYPYCATKAQAETLVAAANSSELTTVILRPRFIWGPGDRTLLPGIAAMVKAGQFTWINGGKALTSTTHIANLCDGIELALTKGRGGEAYFIIDDGTITLRAMISGMARSIGLTLPDKSAPGWLVSITASLCERMWRLFRLNGAPPITPHIAMVMSRDCTLNGEKAARDLGYVPRITREAGLAAMKAAS